MMTTRFLFMTCWLLFSLVSCQKEADLIDCKIPNTSLTDFLTRYAVPTTVFTYHADSTNHFTSLHGTRLLIPPAAFRNADGSTAQRVLLEFREVLNRGDMVLSGTPTVSYGTLLESSGMFFLRATQGGYPVSLNAGVKVEIRNSVPAATSSTLGMQAFFSNTTDIPGQFTWALSPDSTAVVRSGNTMVTKISYLASSSVNWLNCDRFVDGSARAPVQVQPQGLLTTDQTETAVYVVFNSLNGALRAYPTNATSLVDWTTALAPTNLPITAVALQYHEGKFYYGAQTGTTGTATPLRPVLTEMSEEEIAEALRKL